MPSPLGNVSFTMDRSGFARIGLQVHEKVIQGTRQAAGRVRDRTKRNIGDKGRVDSGRMRQSVDYRLTTVTHSSVEAEVGIYVHYAKWQEEGNGPPGTFIYPKRAKVLRFRPKGGGAFVYAKRVKVVKPMHALRDAVNSLSPRDFDAG